MSESPSSNTEPNDCFPLKMLADLFSILFDYDRLLSFAAMKTLNKTSNTDKCAELHSSIEERADESRES